MKKYGIWKFFPVFSLIFLQFFLTFFLILVLRVGKSPTREGFGNTTASNLFVCLFVFVFALFCFVLFFFFEIFLQCWNNLLFSNLKCLEIQQHNQHLSAND